jgi:hypothetical protein
MIKPLALVMALSFAPAAFAQTYIVPDGDCGSVTLHATRGTDFPYLGESIGADHVKNAYVYASRRRIPVKPEAGKRSLDFEAKVPADEVVMASVDFAPEIRGSETRTDHAKAILFCGPVTPAAEWQRETGIGLEIYPQEWNGRRPQLKPGDSMRFIAVDKSTGKAKMLRDVPMELYGARAGRIATGVPDVHGGVDFPYQEPGRYMVTTTYRRPDPKDADHWLVDTSTLTFDIK